nr:MAG TPA: intron associated endonuclease [Caudoviricetes sp.]
MTESKYTWCVYLHTNKINNKKYVGITSRNPLVRWQNGNGYSSNKHFYNSIKKYGWENGFTHEVLYTNLSEEKACEIEKELITKYQSYNMKYGYNQDMGGHTTGQHSQNTKTKISLIQQKIVFQYDRYTGNFINVFNSTLEAEKHLNIPNSNISSVCTKKVKTTHDFIFRYEKDGYIKGENLSLEELKIANSNMSETLVGKYLPDGKTLIKKYLKIKDAIEVEKISKSRFYKILDSGVIYNGYIWKRIKNTYAEKFLTLYEKKRNTLKRILQYSKEGKLIQSYENIKEAQTQTRIKAKYILESINGRHILAGNYIWREVSDGYTPNIIQIPNDKRTKKEIIQLSLQDEFIQKFESITQAAKCFNISPSAISRCLRGKSSSCHNFHWKYA